MAKDKYVIISKGMRYHGKYYFGNNKRGAEERYKIECRPGRIVMLSCNNSAISVYNDGVYNTRSDTKYSYLDPGVTL
jgi:hypothetical protein